MESQSESYFVVHNESKNRFEIALSGWTAFAEYRVEGDRKSSPTFADFGGLKIFCVILL